MPKQATKSKREPTLLGALVQEQIERLGLGKKIKERQALLVYKEVVGEKIAAVSEATDIQGGKLFVKVSSPAWKEELMFTRHQIAEKINRKMEADVVKQVFLT
jgi:predicted nucleic acid-binding Zn ribbon protein